MPKSVLGILGAGKLGTTLARLAIDAGYQVLIAGSGSVEKIALTIDVLVPGAQPKLAKEVAEQADFLLLALPLGKYRQLPKQAMAGKIVIDAMNYWWEVDGLENTISNLQQSSSERIADFLSESQVVKAFNHMGYHDLEDETRPNNQNRRKAIAYATDFPEAGQMVAQLIDDFGFTPLSIGPLKQGILLEPGSPLFGANLTQTELLAEIQRFPQSPFGKKVMEAQSDRS